MILHDVQQGSLEWLQLRLGIPTASEFHRIITAKTAEFSKQSRAYAIRLVTETVLNRSLETFTALEWMQRGQDLEPQAARAYEFREEIETTPVGFITTDDGLIGASPDRLIGEVGLLEIKCPAPQTHLSYLVDGPGADYRPQVQGQLYVSERDYVDFWSYSPEMPGVLIRTGRDEPFIRKLEAALDQFLDMRDAILEQVRASGYFEERARLLTPTSQMAGSLLLPDDADLNPDDPFGLPPLAGI